MTKSSCPTTRRWAGDGSVACLSTESRSTRTRWTSVYDYPYQWSNTDDKIKHWLFVCRSMSARPAHSFSSTSIASSCPSRGFKSPARVMRPFLGLSNRMLVRPLLSEDGVAVEAEQVGWNATGTPRSSSSIRRSCVSGVDGQEVGGLPREGSNRRPAADVLASQLVGAKTATSTSATESTDAPRARQPQATAGDAE